MPDLRGGFSGNYGYSSNSGNRARKTAQNYQNYGYCDNDGIEFRATTEGEEGSGSSSPTLWKTSSPARTSEAEASLLHQGTLSSASRKLAIARSRKEIMEMVRNMPETSYELSLQDLVEQPYVQDSVDKNSNDPKTQIETAKRKKSQERNKGQMWRSGSMEIEPVMLKMFFPASLGLKKKSFSMDRESKTPSRSQSFEAQETNVDKEWWKRRYSFAGDSDRGVISGINNGSSGSSGSSNNGRRKRRSKIGGFADFFSCFHTKDKTI
ncbi:hypothetical protein NE237_027634 [Protea cynaroides]|uniref:Uncharacterized protein n=1 Tax=Protea cynaroides TaxID=273540 RepID=A0A9Q0GRR4_9MAGN|nr:hypothetical protein NE237_027634 [Protea cynaroides]